MKVNEPSLPIRTTMLTWSPGSKFGWEHLGATNLDNLLPICERHHHHVHEGGWTLTIKPDRTITLRRPDGTLHHEGPTTTNTGPRPPPAPAA